MFGVYIHIPFCRKACTYCNFHFSTNLHQIDSLVNAISREIDLTPLPTDSIKSIYFGGGTPSLLSPQQLNQIMQALKSKTKVTELEEITLECNPEDINLESLTNWQELGINRLSIGLQSLNDRELEAMNRAHNAQQSFAALELLAKFPDFRVSVDLIYGTPWKNTQDFESELIYLLERPEIHHLSAYALTVESKTVLNNQVKKGLVTLSPDDMVIEQFLRLQQLIKEHNWEAYEISNYCKPGYRAIHNANYWKFLPYYGFGPSAHSYNGSNIRYLNIAQNAAYIQALSHNELPRTIEPLTQADQLNERIMTGLRTLEGIDIPSLLNYHPNWFLENKKTIDRFHKNGYLNLYEHRLTLSDQGKLISDTIIAELMWVPDGT